MARGVNIERQDLQNKTELRYIHLCEFFRHEDRIFQRIGVGNNGQNEVPCFDWSRKDADTLDSSIEVIRLKNVNIVIK